MQVVGNGAKAQPGSGEIAGRDERGGIAVAEEYAGLPLRFTDYGGANTALD